MSDCGKPQPMTCPQCTGDMTKTTREINFARGRGQMLFCSRRCNSLFQAARKEGRGKKRRLELPRVIHPRRDSGLVEYDGRELRMATCGPRGF